MTTYLTLSGAAHAEIEIKKSRFLATVTPVDSEVDARAVVDAARREHWDARHTCSAFVLGPDADIQRSSDDGEPSGTAGLPMLEALRGAGVTDSVAVVNRWFGGVLLGTGGLVRAYGDAVRGALGAATIIRRELIVEVAVDLDHGQAARVEGELRRRGVPILDTRYAAEVTLVVGAPPDRVAELVATLASLTAGSASPRREAERWITVPR